MNLVIVTGTTKGLGLALRSLLAEVEGNVVISLSRAPEDLTAALNLNIHADFGNIAAVESAFKKIVTHVGSQHFDQAVLINSAGVVSPVGVFNEMDSAALAHNLAVNLMAPMMAMRYFTELTRPSARQRLIINISSGAAKRPIAGWSAYCVAKAGLEMATQVAALEATANDPTLTICTLAPGVIDTPMQSQVRAAAIEAFPDVERFRAMKADGVLRPAAEVAHDIVQLIRSGKLTHGGSFDIRNFQGPKLHLSS